MLCALAAIHASPHCDLQSAQGIVLISFSRVYHHLTRAAPQAANKAFEVIFVSGDNSKAEFTEYFHEMPWLAVPFEDDERKNALNSLYKVEGTVSSCILLPSCCDDWRQLIAVPVVCRYPDLCDGGPPHGRGDQQQGA